MTLCKIIVKIELVIGEADAPGTHTQGNGHLVTIVMT